MATKLIDHLADDYIFSHDQGLNLAIAFTNFDNIIEPILDKSYGELIFNAYVWGKDDQGEYFDKQDLIPSHSCTDEELGFKGD